MKISDKEIIEEVKATRRERKVIGEYEKRRKEGREVYYEYDPLWIMNWLFFLGIEIDGYKDKQGNINIKVSRK